MRRIQVKGCHIGAGVSPVGGLIGALLLAGLGAMPAFAGAAPDAFDVELRDGTAVRGDISILKHDRLFLRDGARTLDVGLRDVLLLTASGGRSSGPERARTAGAPAADRLHLAPCDGVSGPGDQLVGRVVGGDDLGIRFSLEGGPGFDVPFEFIDRLLPRATGPLDRLILLEGGGFDDRIWRRRTDGALDGLTGVVDNVSAEGMAVDSPLGLVDFELDEVLAVVFADPERRSQARWDAPVVVRLVGGSRFEADLLELGDGEIVLATQFASRLSLPLATLASLTRRAAGHVLLSELTPVVEREWPSVGEDDDFLFPWRRELSVSGAPLTVGGVLRSSGLGVHANSRLTFELPEGAVALRVTVGLVDEVLSLPAEGSVTFDVEVDGELRAGSGVLREGDAPMMLRVGDLAGHSRLVLRTGDAGDFDAGDRAAWVDGVLLLGLSP